MKRSQCIYVDLSLYASFFTLYRIIWSIITINKYWSVLCTLCLHTYVSSLRQLAYISWMFLLSYSVRVTCRSTHPAAWIQGSIWHRCNRNMQTDPPNSMPSVRVCLRMCVFLRWLDSAVSVRSLFFLTLHGNKPSLFLMIYPCHVLEEPPGMPLQRFVLFDGLAGWKTQAEVWQGTV